MCNRLHFLFFVVNLQDSGDRKREEGEKVTGLQGKGAQSMEYSPVLRLTTYD